MKLFSSMLSLEVFQGQLSAVMETLVEAALAELGTLLDQRSAAHGAMAARQQLHSANRSEEEEEEEEESEVTSAEERQHFNKAITSQFASLMDTWARGAVEKIMIMLKASVCEAEDGPEAEQRAGRSHERKQSSTTPEAGRDAAPPKKKQRQQKLKIKPVMGKTDHLYHREGEHTEEPTSANYSNSTVEKSSLSELHASSHFTGVVFADAATHESHSGSPFEPEAVLTGPVSEPASDGSGQDAIEEDASASPAASEIKQKKTTGPFKCPSCDKSFGRKCLMDRHYLTHSKPHLCSECGKRFAGQRALSAHARRHTGEKLYKCSDCGTEFAYKSTFDRHMRRHSLEKPVTHTCALCESHFTGLLALQRHRCCALKKTFVCSRCPETFDCRQSLADHENLHSGDRDFVCEMCGETFFTSSSLATHRVTHTQRKSCCDVLGLGSSDPSVLRNHLSKHTGEKLFSCEVCGKGCSHRSALKHHMLTHTGERPYVCDTCGKRCGHASALENHMRVHTGKKPGQQPVCNMCGKKFRRTVNLKYHMSVHTGVKPYACEQCGKKFSNPSNRKLHMVTHSGEKMYGCNICGGRFTQASSLRLHRRVHTGEWPHRCVVCGKGFLHRRDFKKHQGVHLPDREGASKQTAVKI